MNLQLMDRAMHGLLDGSLPIADHFPTVGGPTTGAMCAVCHLKVPRDSLVIEVTVGTDTPRSLCMHVECHGAWLAALMAMQGRRDANSAGGPR